MEFKVRCVHKNRNTLYDMDIKEILNDFPGITNGAIYYKLVFENSKYFHVPVSVNKINGKYEVSFTFMKLTEKALNEFIYYLEENHEKNIVELSI